MVKAEVWQSRFTELLTQPEEIVVGGCGGTGSHITFLLQCLGHNVYIYDDDKFEIVNIGTQFTSVDQINKPKVEAIQEVIMSMLETCKIIGFNEKYTSESKVTNIMFSCFDNMKAREIMYNNWKQNPNRKLLIDIRMDAYTYQIFFVIPENERRYENNLFPDEEAKDPICGLKQSRHVGFIACGNAIAGLLNYLNNDEVLFYLMEDLPSLYRREEA